MKNTKSDIFNFKVIRNRPKQIDNIQYKVIKADENTLVLLKKKRNIREKPISIKKNEKKQVKISEKIKKSKESKERKALTQEEKDKTYKYNINDDDLLDFDRFYYEIFNENSSFNLKSSSPNKTNKSYKKEVKKENIRKKCKQVSSLSIKSIKSNGNNGIKKSCLKKKKRYPSNLFDIDNFIVHSSSKINDKSKILNIPIPKYSLIEDDFYNINSFETTKSEEDISDEKYNMLHSEFENRERMFKQSFLLQKKKSNKENHETLPCMFSS